MIYTLDSFPARALWSRWAATRLGTIRKLRKHGLITRPFAEQRMERSPRIFSAGAAVPCELITRFPCADTLAFMGVNAKIFLAKLSGHENCEPLRAEFSLSGKKIGPI